MAQRPRDDEDPTSEEQALEFDGSGTDQLDDTYRFRVVAASENASGTVRFNDRGQSHRKWSTEVGSTDDAAGETADQLAALDAAAMSFDESAPDDPQPPTNAEYDPDPTAPFVKPKFRR